MKMSEFAANVLHEMRSLNEDSTQLNRLRENLRTLHPLIYLESIIEEEQLEQFLLNKLNCTNEEVELHMPAIQDIIDKRISKTRNKITSFQISPYSKINMTYAILAKHVARYLVKPVYHVLFSKVEFDRRFLLLRLQPYEFILVEREKTIPVSIIEYLDNLRVSQTNKKLLKLNHEEERLIINHSDLAQSYAHAILMNEAEEVVNAKREKLVTSLKSDNYVVTADYGKEGEKNLALSILPDIDNWQLLVAVLSAYIPKSEWSKSMSFINNQNLYQAMLKLEYNKQDLSSSVIVDSLKEVMGSFNKHVSLLERLFLIIREKETFYNHELNKIPDLLIAALKFNTAELLHQANNDMRKFKSDLQEKMQNEIKNIPYQLLQKQIAQFSSPEEMIEHIVRLIVDNKIINTFKNMSHSDLFMLMMNFDFALFQEEVDKGDLFSGEKQKKNGDEIFLSLLYKQLTKPILAERQIPRMSDTYVRAYLHLLAELYKRQRDQSGDSILATTNCKQNKINSCELLQFSLVSDYPLHELYAYPLDCELTNDSNLVALYTPLMTGTLGEISKGSYIIGVLLDQYCSDSGNRKPLSIDKDKQFLSQSMIGRINDWELIIDQMSLAISRKKWDEFIMHIADYDSIEKVRLYLATTALNVSTNINDIMTVLLKLLPTSVWQSTVTQVGFTRWASAILNFNLSHIKESSKHDAFQFENKFWLMLDNSMPKLIKQPRQFVSFQEIRAYSFCLAMTYLRQREKRGEYSSRAAKAVSMLNVSSVLNIHTLYQRADKVAACKAFINYLLSENEEFSEARLMAYLQTHYKQNAGKYYDILTKDSLGELIKHILSLTTKQKNVKYMQIN